MRKANSLDIQQLSELEHLIFINAWDSKQWQYEMSENPFAFIYVLEEKGQIIAYFDVWITFEQAQIAKIAVHPTYQGQGFGTLLMQKIIAICDEAACESLSLEVRKSNQNAIALYKKFEFLSMAERKQYYPDGEDAILMVKALGGGCI